MLRGRGGAKWILRCSRGRLNIRELRQFVWGSVCRCNIWQRPFQPAPRLFHSHSVPIHPWLAQSAASVPRPLPPQLPNPLTHCASTAGQSACDPSRSILWRKTASSCHKSWSPMCGGILSTSWVGNLSSGLSGCICLLLD